MLSPHELSPTDEWPEDVRAGIFNGHYRDLNDGLTFEQRLELEAMRHEAPSDPKGHSTTHPLETDPIDKPLPESLGGSNTGL